MSRVSFQSLGLFLFLSSGCVPLEIVDAPAPSAVGSEGGATQSGGSDQDGDGGDAGSTTGTSAGGSADNGAGGAGGDGHDISEETLPPSNPLPSSSVCDDPEAHHAYLLNEIFIREGHPFLHVDAAWANLVDQTQGINHWNPAGWNLPYSVENQCEILLTDADSPFYNTCDSDDEGRCHCWDSTNVCRCDKLLREAHKAVCGMIFNGCTGTDALVTRTNIFFAATVKYLTDGQMLPGQWSIYSVGGVLGVPSANDEGSESEEDPPECMASPLVLDLAGDGVNPTSLRNGTRFNLMGFGVQNTSWIQGDDALLVLDRNGNGTIDDGRELFGAGTSVNGRSGCDGFTALAPLDTNGNGRIDARDAQFANLRLWRDSNGDGISQPTELSTLASLRVASVGLDHSKFSGQFDQHGNELSMQGSFTRGDGTSGLVVDVYFVTGR